jgi:RNA polymerase sigma-70 factor (ECF subfamily)
VHPDLLGRDIRSRRFEAIFLASHRRVLAYALRRAEGSAEAEEAVSETFLVAWRRLDEVPDASLPWLLATTRRVLANQRRSSRRRNPAGPHVDLDQIEVGGLEAPLPERLGEQEAFVASFASLGERDREVLALIAWDGLEVREAAAAMGCSAPTFSLRLHRARRRLLKALSANGHSLAQDRDPDPATGISAAKEEG